MRRVLVLITSLFLLLSACEKSKDQGAHKSEEPHPIAAPSSSRDTVTDQDLLALHHLADVYDSNGLYVDFGTAARFKYTNGNWQSGWIDDRKEGEASVSTFRGKARIYLPADDSAAGRVRIRVAPYAPGKLTMLLNGKRLGPVQSLEGEGLREITVEIPPDVLRAGENELELRATGSAKVDGETRSAALDWLRLERLSAVEGGQGHSEAPSVALPVAPLSIGEASRAALRLEPGEQLDWFLEVPQEALLRIGAGSLGKSRATLRIEMTGERANQDARLELGTKWTDDTLPLVTMAGDVARLRLRNEGPDPIALSKLQVERSAGSSKPNATQAQARNVIVLLVDTLRATKLRLYNPQSRVATPVLDAFASQGTLFDRAQAPENWTKPSVASVLTSLYPSSHLVQTDSAKLSDSITMISEIYQKAGFDTASFITNSFVSPEFGFNQGWDLNVNMDYLSDTNEGKAENVFAAAGDWVEKHQSGPFFLYVQTIDPHAPYDPPPRYLEMYDPKPYEGQVKNQETPALILQVNKKAVELTDRDEEHLEALHDGEITYHDTELGKFLAKLQSLGLDQNTLVVVTSDHGEEFGEHGQWGHGNSVYQDLLHVPLVFRWPGVIPANERIDPPVSIVDIGPTVLEASGVAVPKELEGRSLMGFMLGDQPRAPHVAFSDWVNLYRVIRSHDWKLVAHAFFAPELYDLRTDPDEQQKLDPSKHPVAQHYLRTLLGQFLGAPDLAHWLAPTAASSSEQAPARTAEEQKMTPELCRQLVALGYVVDECD